MKKVDEQRKLAERRCILTGNILKASGLIRMVQGPSGKLVPDVLNKLPGRGIWMSCDGKLMTESLEDGRFVKSVSRALKKSPKEFEVPENLVTLLESLLSKQALSRLGIENRAAHVVCGFEKVRTGLRGTPAPRILLNARDGAGDGKRKLSALAAAMGVKVVEIFDRDEMSVALGRENVVHSLLLAGCAEKRLVADINRLAGFRLHAMSGKTGGSNDEE